VSHAKLIAALGIVFIVCCYALVIIAMYETRNTCTGLGMCS